MRIPPITGRPWQDSFAEMNSAREQHELKTLVTRENLRQVLQKTNLSIPEEVLQAIIDLNQPGPVLNDLPTNQRDFILGALRRAAWHFVGISVSPTPHGVQYVDLAQLFELAIAIEFTQKQNLEPDRPEDDPEVIFTFADGHVLRFKGKTALAARRYMVVSGVLPAIWARQACPECEPGSVQPWCQKCNGLGWIAAPEQALHLCVREDLKDAG